MTAINLALTPEPWTRQAACASVDPDLFFPTDGDSASVAKARKICRSCDAAAECEAYARRNREEFGVWGGKTAQQIRKETRR